MTIASENNKIKYTGNDVTSIFAYNFRIVNAADLLVTIADSNELVPDNSFDLILNTDYTVSDVGEDAGGNVTLLDLTAYCGQAKLPTGWILSIRRVVEVIQETDLETQGEYSAETFEAALDYLTMIDQQQENDIANCVKVSDTSDVAPEDLLDSISDSENAAAASAAAAAASEANASTSEANASTSEANAATSEANALASENAAAASAASIDQAFTKLKGRRATGAGSLAAFKLIKVNGDYPTDTVPTIDVVSSFSDSPIGFTFEAFNEGETDLFLEKGRVVITGFDCSTASIGDKVYADASGDPTLIETDFQIGYVIDNAVNGIVYIDVGAGGAGSGLIDGTDKRLGVERISVVDTDTDLYSPSSGYAYGLKIIISNDNNSGVAKVRVANRDGAIADEDYIIYDMSIGAKAEPIVIELPGVKNTETITVRSDTTLVNFALFGEESSGDKKAYCLGRDTLAVADTDEDIVSFTEENQIDILVCNRSISETAILEMKLADTASEAAEDNFYHGQILPNQSKAISLDLNVANAYKLMAACSHTDISIQVYSRAKTQFGAGMLLPVEVQLKKANSFGLFALSANQTTNLTAGNEVDFDSSVINQGLVFDIANNQWTLKAGKSYDLVAELSAVLSAASGYILYQFYDVTNSTYIGSQGSNPSPQYAGNDRSFYYAKCLISPETDIVVELRIVSSGNITSIASGTSPNYESTVKIIEVSSLIDYIKNPYQVDYYQVDLSVSGTNWTTTRAVGLVYKDPNGVWRLKFNISGTTSVGTTSLTLTLAGVSFPASAEQGCTGYASDMGIRANDGASTLLCLSTSSRTTWVLSGGVELEGKPDFI